ncbi:uncharacterized protein APUU_61021S [Aspergillus puulaauensis]|uniref:Rhodopsin domain-containing protein n=1 Tax=Aspergillus puulaauensis TaxID=1220207 RepID=A0A7R7XW21_9EURO|nr:uncharacterized protein APUU_61021S [Aspergillus puulaauensis]BCS27973.1 hypothetical protein APUU_61021S [Aspergillus puulaauensis]
MTATPFQKEAWIEYGIGVIVILFRLFARFKVVGFKNWQGDDYFSVIALIFWTAECTMLELIGQYGTNIGLTDEQRAALSPAEEARLVFGSKCLMAGWTCYVTLIWSLKACMLFFYNRLTLGLTQQKLVKFNALLCACTFVAVIFTIFLHCRPIERHFQVYPDPGLNCSADFVNYIVIAATNVLTDGILLCIPIPLLLKVRLQLRRKLIIGVLLCGGVFVMAATLLRCILSVKDINSINNSTVWAIRETFVAIIAVNAPCIKPLFSSSIWIRSSSKDPSSGRGAYGKSTGASFNLSNMGRSKHHTQLESTASKTAGRDSDEFGMLRDTHNGSSAQAGRGDNSSFSDEESGRKDGGIQVTTMYEVRRDGH